MLAAWASQTRRVRLGTLVNAMTFRNPALLAKLAATVDHISGGRLELGVGAAWHLGEHRAYGIPLGTVKERLDRFGEGLEVLRLLFSSEERVNFIGQYYTLDHAPFAPGSVQAKLPLLIGGGGEKRTLRLVAQYADSYNFFANGYTTPQDFKRKLDVLGEHCATLSRDPGEIRTSVALWADLVDDEQKAAAKRDNFSPALDAVGKDLLLFGSAQRILDKTAEILQQTGPTNEVIFCGIQPDPEVVQRFDETVVAKLISSGLLKPATR